MLVIIKVYIEITYEGNSREVFPYLTLTTVASYIIISITSIMTQIVLYWSPTRLCSVTFSVEHFLWQANFQGNGGTPGCHNAGPGQREGRLPLHTVQYPQLPDPRRCWVEITCDYASIIQRASLKTWCYRLHHVSIYFFKYNTKCLLKNIFVKSSF